MTQIRNDTRYQDSDGEIVPENTSARDLLEFLRNRIESLQTANSGSNPPPGIKFGGIWATSVDGVPVLRFCTAAADPTAPSGGTPAQFLDLGQSVSPTSFNVSPQYTPITVGSGATFEVNRDLFNDSYGSVFRIRGPGTTNFRITQDPTGQGYIRITNLQDTPVTLEVPTSIGMFTDDALINIAPDYHSLTINQGEKWILKRTSFALTAVETRGFYARLEGIGRATTESSSTIPDNPFYVILDDRDIGDIPRLTLTPTEFARGPSSVAQSAEGQTTIVTPPVLTSGQRLFIIAPAGITSLRELGLESIRSFTATRKSFLINSVSTRFNVYQSLPLNEGSIFTYTITFTS